MDASCTEMAMLSHCPSDGANCASESQWYLALGTHSHLPRPLPCTRAWWVNPGLILLACLAEEMWADWQHFSTFNTGIQSLSGEGGTISSLCLWDSNEWKWKFVAEDCSNEKCVDRIRIKNVFLSIWEISKVVSGAMTSLKGGLLGTVFVKPSEIAQAIIIIL